MSDRILGRTRAAIALATWLVACRGEDRCAASESACAIDADAGALCADLGSSWSHCGACFRHCAVGQRCLEGRCASIVCDATSPDCIDRYTRRECTRDGRNFAAFACPLDTVCAAGRCRTWPDDSAWTSVETELFSPSPDLPDWLVTPVSCGSIDEVVISGRAAVRIVGSLYARRALRFAVGDARAASVRFRMTPSFRGELALFAAPGSAHSRIASGVVATVVGSTLRVTLANGAVVDERPADGSPVTVRVELDAARDRLRVFVDAALTRELALSSFPLIGSYFQLRSDEACGQSGLSLEEIRTWSAP